jgi:hypothetical protein
MTSETPNSNFTLAQNWVNETDETRGPFKKWIAGLVGYPCKVACEPNTMGSIDIVVFNIKKNRIADWLEIQPSGAIGVIFEEYENPDALTVSAVNDRCEDYNETIGVEFDESDSEEESDSEGESESESDSEAEEKEKDATK